MARFLDSSVFLHAYLRPKRKLTPEEEEVKARAAKIMTRVEEGEPVATSAIHLAEALNIVEARRMSMDSCRLMLVNSDNRMDV